MLPGKMSQMTIAMWLKYDEVPSEQPEGRFASLISSDDFWGSNGVHFNIAEEEDSVNATFAVVNDMSEYEIPSQAPLTSGTWYHVVATYDNAKNVGNIYINGQLDNTASGTAGPALIGNAAIGAWYNNSRYFDGTLDDIRIYNYALSQDEVAAVYVGKELGKRRNWIPVLVILLVVVVVALATRRKKTTT